MFARSMMSTSAVPAAIAILSTLISLGWAYEYDLSGIGFLNDTQEAIFFNASRSPTASNAIPLGLNSQTSDWRWVVNVTDVLLPDASNADGELINGAHVPTIVNALAWPEGNFLDAFPYQDENNYGEICATVISPALSFTFPSAIDLAFQPGDSCESAFGQQCIDAILNNLEREQDLCPTLEQDITQLSECSETFGQVDLYDILTTTTSIDDDMNSIPFDVRTTVDVLNGDDKGNLTQATNALQIVIFTPLQPYAPESQPQGSRMLCQRANSAYIPSTTNDDESGNGADPSDSDEEEDANNDGNDNSAVGRKVPMTAIFWGGIIMLLSRTI